MYVGTGALRSPLYLLVSLLLPDRGHFRAWIRLDDPGRSEVRKID